eukprot:SAG31_NODE_1613_length_7743_cov_5.584903_1_plen_678_part_00
MSAEAIRHENEELRRANEALQAQAQRDAATINALRASLQTKATDTKQKSAAVHASSAFSEQVQAKMPTEFGEFEMVVFSEPGQATGDIALIYGGRDQLRQAASAGPVLARVHSSCFTGEVVGSHRCDCGEQLSSSLRMIATQGVGVLLYLQQEGRGIGLINKLRAYNEQDDGLDTIDANLSLGLPADGREYGNAVAMLQNLGVTTVRLITNNPDKVSKLVEAGIRVDEQVAIVPKKITAPNFKYLQTKAIRMGHTLGARFHSVANGTEEVDLHALPWESSAPDAATNQAQSTAPVDFVMPTDRPAVLFSNQPPFPVVDVNDMWLSVCGFERNEVVGKTMRIIQGPLTERGEVGRLMDTIFLASLPEGTSSIEDIKHEQWSPPSASMWTKAQPSATDSTRPAVAATLINYTKAREPIRNEIEVMPVGSGAGGQEKPHLLAVSKFTQLSPGSVHRMPITDTVQNDSTTLQAMEAALKQFAAGGMVLVADDTDRENEGDLIVAAQFITPEQVAFMVQYCTGIVCVALEPEICDRLKLPLMVEKNEEYMGTKFCITVDKRLGVTTGVSAYDRAATINALANPITQPTDLVRPGHIFPLRCEPGGVVSRGGHTEASVDLCKLTGLVPAGCICELVRPGDTSGEMARREDMNIFARKHQIPTITIAQMQSYIKEHGREKSVHL